MKTGCSDSQNTHRCRLNPPSARHGMEPIKTIVTRAISSLQKAKNTKSLATTTNYSKKNSQDYSKNSSTKENSKPGNTTQITQQQDLLPKKPAPRHDYKLIHDHMKDKK